MDEIRPVRVEDPEGTTAGAAEVPLGKAQLTIYPGLVDGDVLFVLNLQGVGERPEVDRVATTTCRLAADAAVAVHERVGLRRLDAEPDGLAVAATFEQHAC